MPPQGHDVPTRALFSNLIAKSIKHAPQHISLGLDPDTRYPRVLGCNNGRIIASRQHQLEHGPLNRAVDDLAGLQRGRITDHPLLGYNDQPAEVPYALAVHS